MIALLLIALASAADRTRTVDDSGDTAAIMRSHLDQARFYAQKGWSEDAAAEVEKALATPEGKASFDAHWLGARLAWENTDLDLALELGTAAVPLASNEQQAAQAADFVAGIQGDMGFVNIEAPYPGMLNRLQLDINGFILDPELKRYTDRLAARLHERTLLPVRVGLPAGSYAINGQPVEVAAGEDSLLQLPMSAMGARGQAALQVTRLELGVGTGLWIGEQTSELLPSARAQIGLTLPIGRLLVGPVVEGDYQAYTAEDQVISGTGFSAGARLSTEIFIGGPLALRPGLLIRYASVPGLPLACTEAGESWSCASEAPEGPAHHVYVSGDAVVPGFELLLEHREAGRSTALGTGVRLTVDYARGQTRAGGQAVLAEDHATTLSWTGEAQPWSALGLGMMANLGLAF